MALEMGLAALKALYQLAKMIKEARDNVIIVQNSIQAAQSVGEVIELQMESIGATLPEDIMHQAEERLVGLRRIVRRMKMKYAPLTSILDQLGGSAATIKSMSTRLSKGVLSAAMALSCLSVMMRRNTDREEARAIGVLKKLCLGPDAATLSDEFITSVIADPANSTSDDLLLAAEFTVTPAATEAFLVFRAKCLVLGRTRHALGQIVLLVEELKRQDAALNDELDSEDHDADQHKKAFSLLPSYSKPTKAVAAVSEGEVQKEGKTPAQAATDAALRLCGVELVLDSLVSPSTSTPPNPSSPIVDKALLSKAMGDGFSPERLNFLYRQLGEHVDLDTSPEKVITRHRFSRFLLEEGERNAGFNIALISSAVLVNVGDLGADSAEPEQMKRTRDVALKIVKPLIAYALSFGLLFQSEGMREGLEDDPEEIAALQQEADEKALEGRLSLIEAFAVDFEESYEYGLAPDASLLLSIAIDAGESKYGLGPSTRRRFELLMAILSICNIEADKTAIEKVKVDLKQELSLLTSLGSSSMNEKVAKLHIDLVESGFDSRRLVSGEAATFWIRSFGLSTYEVTWARFRFAFSSFFPTPIPEKDTKRLQFLLSDPRGMVTLDSFRSFTGGVSGGSLTSVVQALSTGSIGKVMKTLASTKQLPSTINDLVTPPIGGGNVVDSTKQAAAADRAEGARVPSRGRSRGSPDSGSPTQKRLAKLRVQGGDSPQTVTPEG